jgi:hypothetical protein
MKATTLFNFSRNNMKILATGAKKYQIIGKKICGGGAACRLRRWRPRANIGKMSNNDAVYPKEGMRYSYDRLDDNPEFYYFSALACYLHITLLKAARMDRRCMMTELIDTSRNWI